MKFERANLEVTAKGIMNDNEVLRRYSHELKNALARLRKKIPPQSEP